jgi:hypothetical protein
VNYWSFADRGKAKDKTMSTKSITAAFAMLCISSSSTLAAATAEEASRILASLQSYVGAEPGVVAVVPEGDDYIITFDAAPLIKKYQQDGFTASMAPTVLKATPAGNGTWAVSSTSPFKFNVTGKDSLSADMSAATSEWNGTFDEALGGFTASNYTFSGITLVETIADPTNATNLKLDYAIDTLIGTSSAVKSGDGVSDNTSSFSMSGVTSATVSNGPTGAFNYTTKTDKVDYTSTVKGFRMRAIMDLVAWFVAHPSKEAITADQAQLKEKVAAALPLWDNLDGGYAANNLVVGTGLGNFYMTKAGFSANANGAVKDGKLREGFSFEGLTIPAGLTPPWSAELIPTGMSFDFSLGGFDLETPAKKFLAEVDFAKDPPLPAGSEAQFLPIFLPNNALSITLNPGAITAPAYTLSYEGTIDASLAGLPKGQMTFRMKGMEDVLAKVQAAAATDPMAQQAMGGLVAAKGFGKTEADGTIVWVIDMTADSKVLINGIDMSAMLGMAPPPQQ